MDHIPSHSLSQSPSYTQQLHSYSVQAAPVPAVAAVHPDSQLSRGSTADNAIEVEDGDEDGHANVSSAIHGKRNISGSHGSGLGTGSGISGEGASVRHSSMNEQPEGRAIQTPTPAPNSEFPPSYGSNGEARTNGSEPLGSTAVFPSNVETSASRFQDGKTGLQQPPVTPGTPHPATGGMEETVAVTATQLHQRHAVLRSLAAEMDLLWGRYMTKHEDPWLTELARGVQGYLRHAVNRAGSVPAKIQLDEKLRAERKQLQLEEKRRFDGQLRQLIERDQAERQAKRAEKAGRQAVQNQNHGQSQHQGQNQGQLSYTEPAMEDLAGQAPINPAHPLQSDRERTLEAEHVRTEQTTNSHGQSHTNPTLPMQPTSAGMPPDDSSRQAESHSPRPPPPHRHSSAENLLDSLPHESEIDYARFAEAERQGQIRRVDLKMQLLPPAGKLHNTYGDAEFSVKQCAVVQGYGIARDRSKYKHQSLQIVYFRCTRGRAGPAPAPTSQQGDASSTTACPFSVVIGYKALLQKWEVRVRNPHHNHGPFISNRYRDVIKSYTSVMSFD